MWAGTPISWMMSVTMASSLTPPGCFGAAAGAGRERARSVLTRLSTSKGLMRMYAAPAEMHSERMRSLKQSEKTIDFVSGESSGALRSSAIPSSPGMSSSLMRKSGRFASRSGSACAPPTA